MERNALGGSAATAPLPPGAAPLSVDRVSTVRVVPGDATDPYALRVTTSTDGDVGIVSAGGELDAHSAGRLREACDDVFARGHAAVVLDLGEISFIDSSGLSVLIYAYKEALDRDASLSLRSPSAAVTRLLEITGQAERFLGPAV